ARVVSLYSTPGPLPPHPTSLFSARAAQRDFLVPPLLSVLRTKPGVITAPCPASRKLNLLGWGSTGRAIAGKAVGENERDAWNRCVKSKPRGRCVTARMSHRLPYTDEIANGIIGRCPHCVMRHSSRRECWRIAA